VVREPITSCPYIAEGDEWKTAFRTRYGSYEFQVIHYGTRKNRILYERRSSIRRCARGYRLLAGRSWNTHPSRCDIRSPVPIAWVEKDCLEKYGDVRLSLQRGRSKGLLCISVSSKIITCGCCNDGSSNVSAAILSGERSTIGRVILAAFVLFTCQMSPT